MRESDILTSNNEYAKWLTSLLDFYGKYHHHKETMAWVITALYVPGVITLGLIVNERGLIAQGILTFFLVVIFWLVRLFVNMSKLFLSRLSFGGVGKPKNLLQHFL